MAQNNQEEIDLLFFFKKFNQFLRKGVVSVFRGLSFIRRNWIVILILIAAGIGYGYYLQSKTKPSQKASLLVRINFDAVNNVYNIVDNLNTEIIGGTLGDTGDPEVDKELNRVLALELTPVVNIKEILNQYDFNDRRLEGVVKNLDFDFDEEGEFASLSETFRTEYRFHYLEVTVTSSASENTVDNLLKYINETPLLKELKVTGIKSLEDRIASTGETIKQIDQVLDSYSIKESSPQPNAQLYVVDKNFNISEIFKNKVSLQMQLETLKSDLVYAKDVIVNVNRPGLYIEKGLFSNKMVAYPLLFVFVFFGLAFIRNAYFSMKRMADEESPNG